VQVKSHCMGMGVKTVGSQCAISDLGDWSIDVLIQHGLSREAIDYLRDHENISTVDELVDIEIRNVSDFPMAKADKKVLTKIIRDATREAALADVKSPTSFPQSAHDDQRTTRSAPAEMQTEAVPVSTVTQVCSTVTQISEEPGVQPNLLQYNPSCPTPGSKDHNTRRCVPCAWSHCPEGCRHGAKCIFCHLCPPGEIKRRKKEKKKQSKCFVEWAQTQSPEESPRQIAPTAPSGPPVPQPRQWQPRVPQPRHQVPWPPVPQPCYNIPGHTMHQQHQNNYDTQGHDMHGNNMQNQQVQYGVLASFWGR